MSDELRTLLLSVGVVGVALVIVPVAPLVLVYAERKLVARIQRRFGPWHVGPMGLLQTVADMIKLLLKEDLTPRRATRMVYLAAPFFAVIPAMAVVVGIPFAREWLVSSLDFGLLYVLAIPSLGILGFLMAGWGSGNKYAMIGTARVVAQAISYELPLVIAAVSVALVAGSMNLAVIVEAQTTIWFGLVMPVAFVIFVLAGLAELARVPFDITIAESEIMGGPWVEYSGLRWSMFMLTEYASMVVLAVLTSLLFLGGWQGPWLPGTLWLVLKAAAVILLILWMRGAVPRLRIDQLMSLAWRVMLPLAFMNLIVASVYVVFGGPATAVTGVLVAIPAFVFYRARWRRFANPAPVKPTFRTRATV